MSLGEQTKKMSEYSGETLRRDALKARRHCELWASEFMQPWLGPVENEVEVVLL